MKMLVIMNFRQMSCASLLALGLLLSACGGGKNDDSVANANANVAPVANAGWDQTVTTGDTVTVDGSFSSDADGNTLTYQWTLTSKPAGSTATLSSVSARQPKFVANDAGIYTASLVVNDGVVSSNASTVTINTFSAPAYTKLDANGLSLTDSAVSWSCVRDNASKLIWELKTKDGGLRDWIKSYTNFDSTSSPQLDGMNAPTQTQIDAGSNSVGFRNAVNIQSLCGSTDWRLPTQAELSGLLKGSSAPYINTTYFPDVDLNNGSYGWFWSSSPVSGHANFAWLVLFNQDHAGAFTDRNHYHLVRLVRSGP